MKRNIISIFISFMVIFPALAHTKVLCDQPCHNNQGYELEDHEYLSAFNAPSRYETTNPWNFVLEATYLFWQPIEEGLEVLTDASEPETRIINLNTPFNSSFKTTLGIYCNDDNLLFSGQYTWLRNSSSRNDETLIDNTLYPVWFEKNTPISQADAKWKVHLDIIDLAFMRSGYTGKNMTFALSGGLKVGRLDQSFSSTYTFFSSGIAANSSNHSDSWLIGPQVGFTNKILLGTNFHIFNSLSSSLSYQRYHVKSRQQNPSLPSQLSHRIHYKDSKLTPTASLATGIGFNLFAPKERWHLSVSVGYEVQAYWEQNMMRSLLENTKSQISRGQENLYFHGLTAIAACDF